MYSLFDWANEGDFSAEKMPGQDNLVRLEDWRATRDRLSGRDRDDELLILPRKLGIASLEELPAEERPLPELTPIDGYSEAAPSLRGSVLPYSPVFILGGIAAEEIIRKML